ncbi:MAG: M1 family metallopeptidase [Bacteroidota bacterium]
MQIRLAIVLGFLLLAASCSTSQKSTKDKNDLTVDLDSIEVVASRDNPYRAAATKDFDLTHTKLEVKFDYSKQYLIGKATITLKPHFYPQHELVLDAKQFDIREVSLITGENSREGLEFTYDSLQLKIQLDKEYTRNQRLEIYIDYTAKPEERKIGGSAAISEDKGLYFINPLGTDTTKPVQIWTQGETEASSCWFPTIDKPNQKFTQEIYITHLKKYVSLSNGSLVSSVSVNDSVVTDYWKMDLPHAPYLAMMAIGDFSIVRDRWRDVPVNYYVEKEYAPYAMKIFGNTPEMMEFFSQKLGFDYPWPKYSQVVVRDYVSGAMENTSATLHGQLLQRNSRELLDETYEDVISHELFHQWFGDLITTESWSNIPLNESFATYGEYLWNEYKYGKEHADFKLYENYEKYLLEAKDKNVDLIRFYYNSAEDMFDRHSYEKGGLLLHYLREITGDEAFFKSIELYLKSNQFKSVEINHLRLAFEEVTGKDLNWFFNEWFLNSGHPVLDINYSYDADSIYVSIGQTHNSGRELTYQLPMRIDVWYGKVVNSYKVVVKKKSQVFAFKAYGKPDLIDADADRVVLCEKKENKTIGNYIFQYNNTPLYAQRFEALEMLAKEEENLSAQEALVAAINDKASYLREYAIDKMVLPKENPDSLYKTLERVAKSDPSSWVRKAAIEKLSKSSSDSAYISLFETAIGDSSYAVVAASLKALNETDSKRALQVAKQFEKEMNNNILTAVADIYSKEGDSLYQNYFSEQLRKLKDISKYSMYYYYANYLTRMNREIVLSGIKIIEEEAMLEKDQHFMIAAAKGSLKRIAKSFEDKKKKAQSSMNSKMDSSAKPELQEHISDYETIVKSANDALERIGRKKIKEN